MALGGSNTLPFLCPVGKRQRLVRELAGASGRPAASGCGIPPETGYTSALDQFPHDQSSAKPVHTSRGAVEGRKDKRAVIVQWGTALAPLEHSPCRGLFWVPERGGQSSPLPERSPVCVDTPAGWIHILS